MYTLYKVCQYKFLFLDESCTNSQLQTSPEYGQGMNPISRLAQIQQAKKEKEPEYTLVTERGLPRRREFVMQVLHQREDSVLWLSIFYSSSVHFVWRPCSSGHHFQPVSGKKTCLCIAFFFFFSLTLTQVSVAGQNAEGMGPSKKVAKRNAAEKMLELLGFKVPQPQPPKPALKTDEKVSVCLLTVFNLHPS